MRVNPHFSSVSRGGSLSLLFTRLQSLLPPIAAAVVFFRHHSPIRFLDGCSIIVRVFLFCCELLVWPGCWRRGDLRVRIRGFRVRTKRMKAMDSSQLPLRDRQWCYGEIVLTRCFFFGLYSEGIIFGKKMMSIVLLFCLSFFSFVRILCVVCSGNFSVFRLSLSQIYSVFVAVSKKFFRPWFVLECVLL